MKRHVIVIPTPWRHRFGQLSIHQVVLEDVRKLADHYDITILQQKGWGFPEGPWRIVESADEFRADLPVGGVTPDMAAIFVKTMDNKDLVLCYDPITPLQLGGMLYNHHISRLYAFPKFVLRFVSNALDFSREPFLRRIFQTTITSLPVIWNSGQAWASGHRFLVGQKVFRPDTRLWYTAPLSIDTKRIDQLRGEMWPKPDVVTVRAPWNRIAEVKQPELFLEVVTTVAALRPIRAQVPISSEGLTDPQRITLDKWRKAGIEVLLDHHAPADRDGYYRSLGGAHAFLSTSKSESFGLTQLEYLYAGMIGVYLDADYLEMLPGYPFVANRADLAPLLMAVLSDIDAAQERVEPFRAYIREKYSYEASKATLLQVVENLFKLYVDRQE